jgi:hypothetical protein
MKILCNYQAMKFYASTKNALFYYRVPGGPHGFKSKGIMQNHTKQAAPCYCAYKQGSRFSASQL